MKTYLNLPVPVYLIPSVGLVSLFVGLTLGAVLWRPTAVSRSLEAEKAGKEAGRAFQKGLSSVFASREREPEKKKIVPWVASTFSNKLETSFRQWPDTCKDPAVMVKFTPKKITYADRREVQDVLIHSALIIWPPLAQQPPISPPSCQATTVHRPSP